MKTIYKLLTFLLVFGMAACVDDYTDANPKPLLDGPAIYVYAPNSTITSRRSDNVDVVYTTKGANIDFDVDVVDAPGGIASSTATLSDTVGTIAVGTNFNALVGSTAGNYTVTYTPRPDDPASTFDDRVVTATINIKDEQGKANQPETRRVRAISCLPTKNLAGWWRVTASGNNSIAFTGDNGNGTYTNLKAFVRMQIRTTGNTTGTGLNNSNVIAEHAGELFLSDASFGLYPKQIVNGQPKAVPPGRVRFCGSTLTNYQALNGAGTAASGTQGITMTGTINDDGTVTINWQNLLGDTGTVTLVWDGY